VVVFEDGVGGEGGGVVGGDVCGECGGRGERAGLEGEGVEGYWGHDCDAVCTTACSRSCQVTGRVGRALTRAPLPLLTTSLVRVSLCLVGKCRLGRVCVWIGEL